MKQTLMYISSKFKSLLNFENLFKKEYKLDNFNFHNYNKNSANYDYIANKIKRNIFIFLKNCNNTCKLESTWISSAILPQWRQYDDKVTEVGAVYIYN